MTRISGLNKTIAENIVAYRDENGSYDNRRQLLKVPRLGPKAYEQAVGFLRIINGSVPLDNTDIHPESYPVAKQILKQAGVSADELGTPTMIAKVQAVDVAPLVTDKVGTETLRDIVSSLENPGRDLRDALPQPLLRQDVLTMEDLVPGMKLQAQCATSWTLGLLSTSVSNMTA